MKEQREYHKQIIVFEGPQGSGKSTIVNEVSQTLQIPQKRAFPTGEMILKLSQEEICRASVNTIKETKDTYVYDRSPISQIAYMLRTTGKERYYECLEKVLDQPSPWFIFFLNASVDQIKNRQDYSSSLAVKPNEVYREVNVYKNIFNYIKNMNKNNLHVYELVNETLEDKKTILNLVNNLLKK